MIKFKNSHPVFLAIFPILFLYAQNATEMYLSEIVLPLGLSVLSAIILVFLFRLFLIEPNKSSIFASWIIFSFYSFGHLSDVVSKMEVLELNLNQIGLYLLALIAVISIFILIYFKRTKNLFDGFNRFLNTAVLILIIIQIGVAGKVLYDRPDTNISKPQITAPAYTPAVLPDIYYLIFDCYGRDDILKSKYNYDNSKFINQLESKGFFVADKSYSNYCATMQSLSSSLNLNYIHALAKFHPEAFDRSPLAEMLAENRVITFLRQFGYKMIAFESGHALTELKNADYYYVPGSTLSEFQNILINTTPLAMMMKHTKSQFDVHRNRISYILKKSGNLEKIKEPKFVFAHLISPHPPFVFKKDGSSIERNWPFTLADGDHYTIQGGKTEEYISGYRDQLHYISQQILVTVDKIIANSKTPPIIIIQGDHGPGSGLYWQSLEKTDLAERFSILNALYLPNFTNKEWLQDDLSPVNSFRMILNEYFKVDISPLPNNYFYTTRTKPYKYKDITNQLE